MSFYRHDAWQNLMGALVEVRKDGRIVREGLVDDVMPDSSALWIAGDGSTNRVLIEAAEGYEVWVDPRPLEGKRAYRMASAALRPGAARAHTATRPDRPATSAEQTVERRTRMVTG